ncbi:hypothetical protein CF326_g8675, partial [Tilletia indica]
MSAPQPPNGTTDTGAGAGAIDPAALQLSHQAFADFTQLSPEQLDIFVKQAFGTDPTAAFGTGSGGAGGNAGNGMVDDPSAMLLAMDPAALAAGLPPNFDFTSQALPPGLINPTLGQPQQYLHQHQHQHQMHSMSGPSTSASSTTMSPNALSNHSSTMIAHPQHMGPPVNNQMAIDQAAAAAGWQVYQPQLSNNAATTPTYAPTTFAPQLLHLSQTIPEEYHHLQQQTGMQHLQHPHHLQNQQQQQQQMPHLQHHHSFHHLPTASQQQQHDSIFGPAPTTAPANLSPIDARFSNTPLNTGLVDPQLHSHQSLPQLMLQYEHQQQQHNSQQNALHAHLQQQQHQQQQAALQAQAQAGHS